MQAIPILKSRDDREDMPFRNSLAGKHSNQSCVMFYNALSDKVCRGCGEKQNFLLQWFNSTKCMTIGPLMVEVLREIYLSCYSLLLEFLYIQKKELGN